MNPTNFKKLIKNYSVEAITSDEPHVTLRCDENNITLDNVKNTILDKNSNFIRIVQDRKNIYKLYYKLSRHRELKIIVDIIHTKINIKTVKILDDRFRIGHIKRQRF